MRRVVVTGMGMVSPVGNDVDTSWESALNSKSGVGEITLYDASEYRVRIAAEVKTLMFQHNDKKEASINEVLKVRDWRCRRSHQVKRYRLGNCRSQ